jgi:hypothetical protein
MFVTDELKRRHQATHATYVDFLEALARVCTHLRLPTLEDIKARQAVAMADWIAQVESGVHEGLLAWDLSWQAAES